MTLRRIGVLTGGGDCPGLNAVIRAVVKTARTRYHAEVLGILDGYTGLVNGAVRRLTDADVSGILALGGTILGTSNRGNPLKCPVTKRDGTIVLEDRSAVVVRRVRQLKLDGLVVIGGDGTLGTAQALAQRGLRMVGVPKTIDNDLGATDVSFGFDSALTVATDAVDRLHTTAESHHRIMVLEVMGRYAGWIALRAGMAGGGDVILIPEIPHDIAKVCDAITRRVKRGKRFSLIVVAEGAHERGGQMVVSRMVAGSVEPVRLGGMGQVVANVLEQRTGLESRVTVLGHLQRGGAPTAFDRWLATRFGVAAVDLLAARGFGRMVCLRSQSIRSVELATAVKQLHRVDPRGEEVREAQAVGTSFGN